MGYRATHAPNTPINPPRMNDSRRFCKNVLFGTALTCFDLVDSDTTVDEVDAPGVELVVVDVEPFELVETAGVVPGSSPWGVCPRVVRRFIRGCRFGRGAWWTEWWETRTGMETRTSAFEVALFRRPRTARLDADEELLPYSTNQTTWPSPS